MASLAKIVWEESLVVKLALPFVPLVPIILSRTLARPAVLITAVEDSMEIQMTTVPHAPRGDILMPLG